MFGYLCLGLFSLVLGFSLFEIVFLGSILVSFRVIYFLVFIFLGVVVRVV